MLFGGWVVYHSMWVFGVSGWPRAMVEAVLVLGFLGIAIAQGVRMLDEGKHVETHDVEIGGHEREGLMDSEEAKEMHLSDR